MSSILNSIFKKGTDCMGHKVIFDKNAGICFTRGKKRMRGGNPPTGPEIKKYNAFVDTTTGQSVDFINNIYTGGVATGCFEPKFLNYPVQSTGNNGRVGSKICLKGLRFKGWITLASDQLMQIRWRLVLCRVDALPAGNLTFDSTAYLQMFTNSSTTRPTTWNVESYSTYCRHNFYKKYKNVNNKDFKAKVIATGCLPATNTYNRLYLSLTGTINGQNALLTSATNPAYFTTVHTENVGYVPIDITVALNDNIDVSAALRRYAVVLETDVGYGWNSDGGASQTEVGMLINMNCLGYFTDA